MSKYQAYPEYKDSGVEWVGLIPSHWAVGRLKNVLSIRNGRDYKECEVMTGGYPVYGSGGIFKRSSSFLYDGDSVLFGRKGTIDKPLLVKGKFWTVDTMFYSELKSSANAKYVYGQATLFPYSLLSTNTALPSMTQEDLLTLGFVIPPKNEQQNIANFLDHETAKIDTLIDKQQQLIQLLKEKRQAVISHAVTKGLPSTTGSNAPMRDSGVEWLGEVPEHWEILKGAYIGRLFGSESVSESEIKSTGDIPFVKVSTLSLEGFHTGDTNFYLDSKIGRNYFTRKNYIAFPKRGAAIFTNKVNIITVDSVIDPNLMGWKIGGNARIEFVAYLLKLRGLKDIADVSTVPQINNKHIEPIKFPIPSLLEQGEIICFLRKSLGQFSKLIDKTVIAIELSKERRTALISAAVTGKIDVRDWQAP